MNPPAPVSPWDAAVTPEALAAARRFEDAWQADPAHPPDPRDFAPHDHPGAWLALLRADLGLRREAGASVPVEWYREEYPEVGDEVLVALIYEDFCIREEAGDDPDPSDYSARFPEVADRLRRVFDIHGLIGTGRSASFLTSNAECVDFPEAGQTIAGFRLVEELGRGSFARVYLAQERQLADRPVALKVARTGSREPQTLARLQHTHIVPVHSYRTDPATGLHLLCMPYLGRVTLAQVLADPTAQDARVGADLLAIVDRLSDEGPPAWRASGRLALRGRPFAHAIAWWGARLAEALAFAHERGVLHRDVKPSNVLITADGLPMLLDFNLAREDQLGAHDPTLGGTLAYMAPEHLLALAEGGDDTLDGRADVYALGALLYEAMGRRPFGPPTRAATMAETLRREAERRRAGPPPLRDALPEVPPALAAVVHKCLAPLPADRYNHAADLAADLQAVADDAPLRFAPEPWPDRLRRGARRHRLALAMLLVALATLGFVGRLRHEVSDLRARRAETVRRLHDAGEAAYRRDDLALARAQFAAAARLVEDDATPPPPRVPWVPSHVSTTADPVLLDLSARARARLALVSQTQQVRDRADQLHQSLDPLRSALLGPEPRRGIVEVRNALAPFFVLNNPAWAELAEWDLLDPARRSRLRDDVDDLLFHWVVASEALKDPSSISESVALCDRASIFTRLSGPWQVLRARQAARLLGHAPPPGLDSLPETERSVLACNRWALLCSLANDRERSVAWLKRSVKLGPDQFWGHYLLARELARSGDPSEALDHFDAALSLRPDSIDAQRAREEVLSTTNEHAGN